MSKSVLVINTPDSCVLCPLSHYNVYSNEYECRAKNIWTAIKDYDWQRNQIGNKDIRSEWCPLSPLPEKYEINKEKCSDPFYEFEFEHGYNQCLDEIIGK